MLPSGLTAVLQCHHRTMLSKRFWSPLQRPPNSHTAAWGAATDSSGTTAGSDNAVAANQLLQDVCQQHGIHVHPSIHLSNTQWGLGLCQQHNNIPAKQQNSQDVLVAVPLEYVLSCSIPGCSPSPHQITPAMKQLLHHSEVSHSWGMQVAALLLWALRLPPGSPVGSFWQQYRQLLPGSVQECGSLLVWSKAELTELQDASLQATAEAWQQQVHEAYHLAVKPFFSQMNTPQGISCTAAANLATSNHCCSNSSSSRSSSTSGTSQLNPPYPPTSCSLEEWLWAVAVVESRAFGAARADVTAAAEGGRDKSQPWAATAHEPTTATTAGFTGLVPVLDLANHTHRPAYEHRLDPSTATFSLSVDCSHLQGDSSAAVQMSSSDLSSSQEVRQEQQDQQQVLITYGSKDNRQLMEQYGFVISGNPLDRVSFPQGLLQDQHGWMSHKAVKAAAQRVAARQQEGEAAAHQARTDAAVASVLQFRGWRNAAEYKKTTAGSTVKCAAAMLTAVRQQLQAFTTAAAADSVKIQQLLQLPRSSDQNRLLAALSYRLEHKLLLQVTADLLREVVNSGRGQQSSLSTPSIMAPRMAVQRHPPARLEADSSKDDKVVQQWQQHYPLPDDSAEGSRPDVKKLYRPPRNDVKGIAIACGLITAWAVLFCHGMWQIKLSDAADGSSRRSSWFDIIATFLLLEFVNTGLFITTHDSMHGTICYKNRKLNDWLGRIAITLYAYFDYDMLHKKHWEHHNFTGQPGKDPDFHRGNKNLLVWYGRFMWEYTTFLQIAKIILASQVLQVLQVPYANLCVYMAAAPLLAAFRLFYFGTYLPHLPPDNTTVMAWQKSHSSDDPSWLTFLKCYHFGLHWEHHRWPYAPWWELPKAKAITRQGNAQQQVAPVHTTPGPVPQPAAQ